MSDQPSKYVAEYLEQCPECHGNGIGAIDNGMIVACSTCEGAGKMRVRSDKYQEPEAETRVVDPKTGGEKGEKLCQMGALDPLALIELGKVAGYGARKYARYNYAKGIKWSLSYDALQRHLMAFWGGEDLDPESRLPHAAHACWHCLCLLTYMLRGRGEDDRFPS